MKKIFSYWQVRILIGITFGYAAFYLLRQNFSVASLSLQATFGYTKEQLGWILTVHAITYGVGKALWGMVSDRSNARYFMVTGLLLAAGANLLMSVSTGLSMLMLSWTINACFLSMGPSPCIRLLTHWFSPKEIATKWALWNSAQQIGAAGAVILAAFAIQQFGWRAAFYIPGFVCIFLGIILFIILRDTPQSIGLPSIEVHAEIEECPIAKAESELSFKEIIWDKILTNKSVWYVCFANMFFYVIRLGVLNWAPTFLSEVKGYDLKSSGWQTAIFDVAGIAGGILSGWFSDKVFNGERSQVSCFCVLSLGVMLYILWQIPGNSPYLNAFVMLLLGLFVSGPQILVGVAAADFASKKAAGAANGLTGTFGYLGAAIAGVGIGSVAERFGWEYAIYVFISASILSAFFFVLTIKHTSSVKNRRVQMA